MTTFEILNRLQKIPFEIKVADAIRDGDRAAALEIEQGELEAALTAIEEEEGWDSGADKYHGSFDSKEDC